MPEGFQKKTSGDLPNVPLKNYFTIGEVGDLLNVKPHVLRYWEQEFSQLSPNKRRGNRRYYSQNDVLLARKIRHLLYDEGFTIEGARKYLSGKPQEVMDHKSVLKQITSEIHDILSELDSL